MGEEGEAVRELEFEPPPMSKRAEESLLMDIGREREEEDLEGEWFPGKRRSAGGGEVAERGRRKMELFLEGEEAEEKDDLVAEGSVERNPALPNSSTCWEPDLDREEEVMGEFGERE